MCYALDMKVARITPVLFAVLLIVSGCACREIHVVEYEVLRVVDGDTFEIFYDGDPTRVRILGIDTPEIRKKQVGALEAKAELERLVQGKIVVLDFAARRKRDNFGRLLANVTVEGLDIGKHLLNTSHAKPYRR